MIDVKAFRVESAEEGAARARRARKHIPAARLLRRELSGTS